jgi:DNA-binding response OmpR family regulator
MARILIVEDEEDFAFILKDVLSGAGYQSEWGRDGKDALGKLEKFKPDAILLDWNMPGMDGEAFCRKLRAMPEFGTVPIILLTVKKDADSELEALHFGVDDFLNKPFQPAELLARLRAVLRRSAKT